MSDPLIEEDDASTPLTEEEREELIPSYQPRFTWGRENLVDVGKTRQVYIKALHDADNHDYKSLLEFVRS